MNIYFVSGIGTGIGKTLISSILTEKLAADYWKPIQAGDLMQSDSLTIESLISNTKTYIHPEIYRLNTPASPHVAAKIDGVEISLDAFKIPKSNNSNLIIEGAGGLMVPLNQQDLLIDLIQKLNIPVVLISENYLGSINHTLLSISILKQKNIPIKGIIFNGEENKESQDFILNYTNVNLLGFVPKLAKLDKASISAAGKYINL
ncbi:MAG: dethiobiotin synthase [Sphingobacteriaceae bacterium]|nr:dethiobiotin synthase [Sphingobacteriaceae bacterium]